MSTENLELIKAIIKSSDDLNPRIAIDEVTMTSKFSDDMGFDSMAMMSLIYELQEKYPDLDETKAIEMRSVETLLTLLK